MPTYEYVCSKCGHEFEKFQSMSEKALTVCPKELCGRKKWGRGKVARQIGTGAGLIFKGSGFYITDYRSDSYKEAAKKDTAPASTPSAGAESKSAKTESKPAAKTETKAKPPKKS
jgi:putative FmdB family regulatory protein